MFLDALPTPPGTKPQRNSSDRPKYEFIISHRDESITLGYVGPLVIKCWKDFSPHNLERMEALHHERAALHPNGIIGLNIIEPINGLPTPEARRLAQQMMSRTGSTTRALVLIMLGHDFVRNILQSMAVKVLSARGSVPVRTYRSIAGGVDWIARTNKDAPSPEELLSCITQIRSS